MALLLLGWKAPRCGGTAPAMPMPREKLLGRVIEKMLLLLIHIGNAALGLVGEHGAASARVEGTTVRRNRPGYVNAARELVG